MCDSAKGAPADGGGGGGKEATVTMPEWKWQVAKKLMSDLCRFSYESLQCTAQFLMASVPFKPVVGIICGSGLGAYWHDGTYPHVALR